MTDLDGIGDATVHLRLRGALGDDELTCLRQQLAACLRSGVNDIRVHVDEQDDLDVAVLQALHGVHASLAATGGSVAFVGARPRVLSKLALHGLRHLLAPAQTGSSTGRLHHERDVVPDATTPHG